MMLNLEVIAQFLHHLVIQICTIICDDLVGNTIAANDIILDKSDYHLLSHVGIRWCFNPLGEIVDSHEYETVSIGRFWFNLTNHINAPHRERSQRRNNIEHRWRYMNFIGINLTLVAFLGIVITVGVHCYPVVACSQGFFSHCLPTRMSSE